jgi:predicted tellurium resistance membrane protein TerC
VLAYGIASAAVLRLIVIALGTELVDNFQAVNLAFAAFLIFNAWQMVAGGDDEDEDLSDKWIVKTCRRGFHFVGCPHITLPQMLTGGGYYLQQYSIPLLAVHVMEPVSYNKLSKGMETGGLRV